MTGDLRDHVGDLSQIASVRHLRFDSGRAAGERLVEVRNAAGLCVNLLPDRCLDLGQVWLNGVPFAWMGQPDLPSAKTGATLDTALGGLMATCGFDHVRQPEVHDGFDYPLHGSMCLRPVDTLDVAPATDSEPFRLSAQMIRTGSNGARYTFNRRVEIDNSTPRITIDDTVFADRGQPIMALYHFNLGYPLLAHDTEVRGFDCASLPRTDPVTECFDALSAAEQVVVQRDAEFHRMMLALTFDKSSLPYLQIHTRTSPGSNLLCIEPVTHDRLPRAQVLEREPHSSSKRFHLELDLHVDRVA